MAGQKLLSLDFGSRFIHVVEGTAKNGGILLEKSFLLDAPPGVYTDGNIEDLRVLQDLLRDGLKKEGITAKRAVFTIHSNAVVIRDLVLPSLRESELENAVSYEMEQYLPAMQNGYSLEYRIQSEVADGETRKLRIRAAGMPNDMMTAYHRLAVELRLKPMALDICTNAMSKLFTKEATVNGERISNMTIAAIDYGYRSISVHLFTNGTLDYFRVIPLGGKDMDMALASGLDIPLEMAEEKKTREVRFDTLMHDLEFSEHANSHLYDVASQQMSEINKVFQYHASRNRDNPITKVFLYGGNAGLTGLTTFMQAQLNLNEVTVLKSFGNVTVKTGSTVKAELPCLVNAVGAMLRL